MPALYFIPKIFLLYPLQCNFSALAVGTFQAILTKAPDLMTFLHWTAFGAGRTRQKKIAGLVACDLFIVAKNAFQLRTDEVIR